MPVFYVRNTRIPDGKIVPITVALNQEALVSSPSPAFPDYSDPEGEGIWLLTVSTSEKDSSGNPIYPEFLNVVTTGTVHLEIEAAIGRICQKIDWGTPLADVAPPKIVSIQPPLTQTTDVSIFTDILVRMIDPLPAAGIDFSSITVKINGHNVTGNVQVAGNPLDLTLKYIPTRVI